MRIQRVLVVHRRSLYQIAMQEHAEQPIAQAIARRDPAALGIEQSHRANARALDELQQALTRLGIEVETRWRRELRATHDFDLVISLGGDGTLLDTARRVLDDTPLLGINSDPERSVGALCAGTVADLPRLLEDLAVGRLEPFCAQRLRVDVEGQEVLGPVLNDVLFAHACPAGLTRLDLAVVPAAEAAALDPAASYARFGHYRCSGVWVATALGSTAAIRSAGGQPLAPSARQLQYLVREPVSPSRGPSSGPHQGLVAPDQALVLVNRLREGWLWADGAYQALALSYGQRVRLDGHGQPLQLVLPRS